MKPRHDGSRIYQNTLGKVKTLNNPKLQNNHFTVSNLFNHHHKIFNKQNGLIDLDEIAQILFIPNLLIQEKD